MPSRETWEAAVQKVKQDFADGDRITWYPEWAGEARLSLHGLPLTLLPHHGEVDLGHAKRLWVLGAFGYDGETLADGGHLKPIQELEVISKASVKVSEGGPVSITLLKVGGDPVLHDLHTELSDPLKVQVYRSSRTKTAPKGQQKPHHTESCDFWALNGWHCAPKSLKVRQRIARCLDRPQATQLKNRSKRRSLYTLDQRRSLPYIDCHLNPTEHVSQDWRMIDDAARRCISLSPHQDLEVELRWFIPHHIKNRSIWFSYGWEDLSVRHPFRESRARPIDLRIEQSGQVLFSQSLIPQVAWVREILELPSDLSLEPPAPLSIFYSAQTSVKDAKLCISLDIRAQADFSSER